jgi:hypothetical protein
MYFPKSYRLQFIILSATIILGVYTLYKISNSSVTGAVTTFEGLIVTQADKEPFTGQVVDTIANQIISDMKLKMV